MVYMVYYIYKHDVNGNQICLSIFADHYHLDFETSSPEHQRNLGPKRNSHISLIRSLKTACYPSFVTTYTMCSLPKAKLLE